MIGCGEGTISFSQYKRLMKMKKVGEPVTLTVHWWNGPLPQTGDALRTRTGRRYLILEVRSNKLDCVVLSSNAQVEGHEFQWTWRKRNAEENKERNRVN